jgi:hypothetical protein
MNMTPPSRRLISLLLLCTVAPVVAYLLGAELEHISIALTFCGAIAGAYVLSWQVRIRPHDDQQWAALLFVASATLVLALVCWRYLGGPVVGGTLQGAAAFCGVMIALIALAVETRTVNERILRQKREGMSRREMDEMADADRSRLDACADDDDSVRAEQQSGELRSGNDADRRRDLHRRRATPWR